MLGGVSSGWLELLFDSIQWNSSFSSVVNPALASCLSPRFVSTMLISVSIFLGESSMLVESSLSWVEWSEVVSSVPMVV